ncbi:MAG: hypothetical protein JWM31_785 [Solirubrobacterales bacterium]|nr:hypothetical protein [Solirubrobacterales bacterium]
MSGDAKQLIETAAKSLLEEVPALKPMKLVVGFDLIGGRSDLQQFRLQLPEVTVTKDMATDARIRVEMRREFFNLMVEHGAKVADWREAFHDGKAKANGVEQYLKLILTVVEKQEERDRLRRPKHPRPQ